MPRVWKIVGDALHGARLCTLSLTTCVLSLSLLFCFLPGCQQPATVPVTTGKRLDDWVIVRIEDATQNDAAELTIFAADRTDQSQTSGAEWILINRNRSTNVTTPLRHGTIRSISVDNARTELVHAIRRCQLKPRFGACSLTVSLCGKNGHEQVSITSVDRKLWDLALPHGGSFEPIWKEATGIPKMFWYHDVGPIEMEEREVPQRR